MVGPERTQGGELDSVTFSRAKKREKEEIRGKKRREKEEKRETERREKEERRAEKRAKRESRNGVAAPGNADLSGSAAELASNAAETSNGVGVKASGGVKASSGGKPSAGVKAFAEVKASGVAEVSNAAADSSSEDEEEAKRQAAISSVVVEGTHIMGAAAATATFRHKRKAKRGLQSTLASKERRRLRKMGLQPDGEEGSESENEGEEEGGEDGEGRGGEDKGKDLKLKHYQIRAQDMLHQHLDKLLEMTVAAAEKGVGEGEGGEGGAEDAVNGNVDGSGRDDGETKAALVKTDLAVAIPLGTYARVAPRSGLALKHSINVGGGVVDYDYRGNVGVILFNHSDNDFPVKAGDRVAQLILERIVTPDVVEVEELDETTRGAGGFGSTGGSDALKHT
ncbi:unnamed protein product [Closterium sp. NIES-65]|nr:unnamed protein product [Closterium sp. NIES-65]